MKEINSAIALSDLHLGNNESYLYSGNDNYQKNKEALFKLLKELGRHNELILNGDILELSLAGHDEAYHDLELFFELLSELDLYERIVFIPGNHDHHFWRFLGEQVHINGKIRKDVDPPGDFQYPCCFVNEQFSSNNEKLPCEIILCELWHENGNVNGKPEFIVKYPHHVVSIGSGNGKTNNYLVTHGHFLEKLFKPMNILIAPHHIEELEAFNNFWLETFDYHLGHAGRMSELAKEIEKNFKKKNKQGKKKINEKLNEIYINIKTTSKFDEWKSFLLKIGLLIVKNLMSRITKNKRGLYKEPVSKKLEKSISNYLERYIIGKCYDDKDEDYFFPCEEIPASFTFIFGHTHRPLSGNDLKYKTVTASGKKYHLANTGGWLRTDGTGNGENAGVLVIDQSGTRWITLEGKLE